MSSIKSPPGLPDIFDATGWFRLINGPEDPKTLLTPFETEIIRIHSHLRQNPGVYADFLETEFIKKYNAKRSTIQLSDQLEETLVEGFPVIKETIAYLRKKQKANWKPEFPELKPSPVLNAATRIHSHVSGRLGLDDHASCALVSSARLAELCQKYTISHVTGKNGRKTAKFAKDWKASENTSPHARVSHVSGKSIGTFENLVWSAVSPLDAVLLLLIDDDVPSRGHRTNMMETSHAFIGVSAMLHQHMSIQVSINFSGPDHESSSAVDPKNMATVQDRMRRLTIEDIHPMSPCHMSLAMDTCIVCKREVFAHCGFFDMFGQVPNSNPNKAKHSLTYASVCPSCHDCPVCKKNVSARIDRGTPKYLAKFKEGPYAAYNQTFHRECARKYLNIHCVYCKTDMFDSKIRAHVQQQYIDKDPETWKGAKDKDLMCHGCQEAKFNQMNAKANAELRKKYEAEYAAQKEAIMKKSEEEYKAQIVKTCSYCDKEVLLTENPMTETDKATSEVSYFHSDCHGKKIIGQCYYCEAPIRNSDDGYCNTESADGKMQMLHNFCIDKFFKNKRNSFKFIPEEVKDEKLPAADKLYMTDVTCVGCGKAFGIGEEQHVDKQKQHWHEKCLIENYMLTAPVCHQCGVKISMGDTRSEVSGHVFHSKRPDGQKCVDVWLEESRSKSLASFAATTALPAGAVLSQTTTTCIECKKPIAPEMPIHFENKTYHRKCFENRSSGEICAHCSKPIPESDVSKCEGKTFHGDCVVPYFSSPKPAAAASTGAISSSSTKTTTTNTTSPTTVVSSSSSSKQPHQTTTATTTVISSSSSENCVSCGKPVENNAMISNSKRYHMDCYQKANQSTCAYCLEAITDVFNKCSCEGNDFHSNPDCLGAYFSNGCKPKA